MISPDTQQLVIIMFIEPPEIGDNHVHRTTRADTYDTRCITSSNTNLTFEADTRDVDCAAATGSTNYTSIVSSKQFAGFVEVDVLDNCAITDGTNQTNVDCTGLVDNEVADFVTLAIECADIDCRRSKAIHVASHVDVFRQLCAGIGVCRSIDAPPCKFCAVADFVPAVDGSDKVLVHLSAVFAPAVLIFVRRNVA